MYYLKKRKIIAIVLVACVFIAQLQPALAITIVEKASRDKKTLDEIGITQFATIIDTETVKVGDVDKTEFKVEIGDIQNRIVVLEDSDEKVVIQIKQDEICNILKIYKNGDLVLDGNKVEITREKNITSESTIPEVMPRAGATIYWKDKVSYGSSSDYSNYLKNENISDINLNKMLGDIALSALITVLGGAIGYAVGGAVGAGVGGIVSFATDAGTKIYSYLKARDSQSTHLSCKSIIYTHKNYKSGYIPSLFTYIYKFKTTCYSKAGYGGEKSPEVEAYKYNMQG